MSMARGRRSVRRHGTDHGLNARDRVCRKACHSRMLAYHALVRCTVDAIDLVRGDIAVDPLDARPERTEYRAGALRSGLQFARAKGADTRHVSFDDKFWHVQSPSK